MVTAAAAIVLAACAPGGGADTVPAATPTAPPASTAPTTPHASRAPHAPAPTRVPDAPAAEKVARDPFAPRREATSAAKATVDRNAKVIYLTFDDGPWVPYTRQILDLLGKNGATATFFVVGSAAQRHPELIQRIHAEGHAIGNHTWNHADLTELSDAAIRKQLRDTSDMVGDAMGSCLRPPYGAVDDRVRRIAAEEGYRTYLWTHWAVDWTQPPVAEVLGYLDEVTQDKANILLHDGGGDRPNTVKAVRTMLPRWENRGFSIRPLPHCTTPLR